MMKYTCARTLYCFLFVACLKAVSAKTNEVNPSICEDIYTSPIGVRYDLRQICEKPIRHILSQPKDAEIIVGWREKSVECGDEGLTAGCIHVPGLKPTSVGSVTSVKQIDEHKPGTGVQIELTQGFQCEAIPYKNRSTIILIKCTDEYIQTTAHERPAPHLCEYIITIHSQKGCPVYESDGIVVTAATGCLDSKPAHSTHKCSAVGGSTLTLHGVGFKTVERAITDIRIGQSVACDEIEVVDNWSIHCVTMVDSPVDISYDQTYQIQVELLEGHVSVQPGVVVTFTPVPDFAALFSNLHKYGVAGMKRQAQQIYKRVFLTRTLPAKLMSELGVSHVTGLILHGPPGTGKSLLARAIASIIDTKHVHMVSSPELLNKYVGESENNLRALFYPAEQHAKELGSNSPFHVIILDEIDAICKPRGRDKNNIGSLVYDSLVNQLLTILDGLSVHSNFLVIGLTNRFELLDEALLRPGRLEVHIEMTLPDREERLEILNLHLRKAKASNRLHPGVKIDRLAELTAGFTPAQLSGLVRQAQALALTAAQSIKSLHTAVISWQHLQASLQSVQSTTENRQFNLTEGQCEAYMNVHSVINSTKPHTALVQVENYKLIVPCMIYLLENKGYYVKVIHPDDALKDPYILQRIHQIPSTVRNEKVAVVLVDLCYLLHSCYSQPLESNPNRDHFLLSLRAFTAHKTDGTETALVGICPSQCNIESLKPHFSFVFGMVSLDVGMNPTTSTPRNTTTNGSLKSNKKARNR